MLSQPVLRWPMMMDTLHIDVICGCQPAAKAKNEHEKRKHTFEKNDEQKDK